MIDITLLLAWGATYKKLNTGDFVFTEGSQCHYYYQLVSGKIRWINMDEFGKEFIQILIEPGESFGEFSLFDDEPYAASAIAGEDSVVIRLHKPAFLQLIEENHNIHIAFTRLFSKRLRFKFLILNSVASHDPENLISTLLDYLKSENKNFRTDCNQLKLTRQQIAGMTGLRVETVIRTMRNMHVKGELVIAKGKVYR